MSGRKVSLVLGLAFASLAPTVAGAVDLPWTGQKLEPREVQAVAAALANYRGKVALMSFDHWLIRQFRQHAPGYPIGLTAWGDQQHEIEAHFAMLAHGIDFVSYSVVHLPNPFVTFLREKLAMPIITWTVRDAEWMNHTFAQADQMTFEGFQPGAIS